MSVDKTRVLWSFAFKLFLTKLVYQESLFSTLRSAIFLVASSEKQSASKFHHEIGGAAALSSSSFHVSMATFDLSIDFTI